MKMSPDDVQYWIMAATWVGAIGTIFVTGAGAYAAYWIVHKQNGLIERQTEVELFDKRYQIYEAVHNMLNILARGEITALATQESLYPLLVKAKFLFEEDDVEYLESLQQAMYELWDNYTEMQLTQGGEERNKIRIRESVILKWIRNQPEIFHLRFRRYGDFSKFHQAGLIVVATDPRMD